MKRDCKSVWSECLDLIKEQVLPRTFKTWFAPIRALSFKDDVLTIQCRVNMFMNVWKSILWIIEKGCSYRYWSECKT